MKKFRIIVFSIAIIAGILISTRGLSLPNESVRTYEDVYSNADVLIVGSSHAYINLNAATLWKDYGITSVSIGQGEQPIAMSCYMIESEIRRVRPKLIVMECYMAAQDAASAEAIEPVRYTDAMLGYPIWSNLDCRIKSIKSVDTDRKFSYVFNIMSLPGYAKNKFYLGYDKYNSLVGFQYAFDYDTGVGHTDERATLATTSSCAELSESTKAAVDEMVRVTQRYDIPVLYILTPFQATQGEMQGIKGLEKELASKGEAIIDGNSYIDDIGLCLEMEMWDYGHSMASASDKNSRWLGKVIRETYPEIPDRRVEEDYEKWDSVYETYADLKVEFLKKASASNYLRMVIFDDSMGYKIEVSEEGMKALEGSEFYEYIDSGKISESPSVKDMRITCIMDGEVVDINTFELGEDDTD